MQARWSASKLMQHVDGALQNLLTGLGTSADPRSATKIRTDLAPLGRDEIDALVQWHWPAQRYIEELPNEALRKWINLTVDGGPEGVAQDVLDLLEDLEVRQRLNRTLVYERQYGGSALLLGCTDSEDAEKPLDLEGDFDFRFVEPYSCWRITEPSTADLDDDPSSPRFGLPEVYTIRVLDTGDMVRVHHSRVIVFQGWCPYERERRHDWGESVLDRFWPALRDYEASMGYGLGLGARLNETRLKIKGLHDLLMNREKRDAARAMLQEIFTARSVFRVLPVDAEDDIVDANQTFTGFAELIRIARENLSAASGLSLSRFFGLPRQGLGDSDESGAERDDATVAAYQRDRLLGPINRLVEVALASLGYQVDPEADEESEETIRSWQVQFVPLREETPAQRSERRSRDATTAQTYRDMGAVHEDEVREGLRSDPDLPFVLEDGSIEEAFGPTEEELAEVERLRGAAAGGEPGPFIGPEGGKWADPEFTIPWRGPNATQPAGGVGDDVTGEEDAPPSRRSKEPAE